MVFPLFKACTRPPMLMGVPIRALVFVAGFILLLAISFSFFFLLGIPVAILIMREVTKRDDKQFNLIAVWFKTKMRYPSALKRKWNATSYSPSTNPLKELDK